MELLLDYLVEVDRLLEGFLVFCGSVELTQGIYCQSLIAQEGISVLLFTPGINVGKGSAVLVVYEMLDEIVLAIHSRHQVFLLTEHPVGIGESPDYPCIELFLPVGVLVSGKPLGDLPIEAAAGVLHA